jgi:hypothetical protein
MHPKHFTDTELAVYFNSIEDKYSFEAVAAKQEILKRKKFTQNGGK